MDHRFKIKKTDLILVRKKEKKLCQIMKAIVTDDLKVRLNEIKSLRKWLDFVRETKKK